VGAVANAAICVLMFVNSGCKDGAPAVCIAVNAFATCVTDVCKAPKSVRTPVRSRAEGPAAEDPPAAWAVVNAAVKAAICATRFVTSVCKGPRSGPTFPTVAPDAVGAVAAVAVAVTMGPDPGVGPPAEATRAACRSKSPILA